MKRPKENIVLYARRLDFEKEHSLKQVYFAPVRESSLFITHNWFTLYIGEDAPARLL
jgi:hypothetical protein